MNEDELDLTAAGVETTASWKALAEHSIQQMPDPISLF